MGGGSASPDAPSAPLQLQAIAFGAFFAGNVGLNLFNSWALRSSDGAPSWEHPDFNFPFFYTMFHMAVSSSAALLLLHTVAKPTSGMPSPQQLWDYKFSLLPIACCTVLNNGLNNLSLTLVSLFVNQVIKATMPFFVMVFSFFFAQKRFGCAVITIVLCLVAGSVMSNFKDFSKPGGGNTSITGVVVCVISLIANALRPVIAMNVMAGTDELPKLHPTVILFYDTGLSFCMMFLYWLCSYERASSVSYMGSHAGMGLLIIATGSSMAFVFNLANYYFIRLTSALTSGIGANAVKIVLLIVSAIMAHVVDPVSWTGISIVVLSILAYMYVTMKEMIDGVLQRLFVSKPSDADPEAPAKPTEATPLNQQLMGK